MKLVCCFFIIFSLILSPIQPGISQPARLIQPVSNELAVPMAIAGERIAPADVLFVSNLNLNPFLTYSYRWDFGDGTSSDDINPIHRYLSGGTYQVSFRIWQENQLVFTNTFTETILEDPTSPSIQIDSEIPLTTTLEQIKISGSIELGEQKQLRSLIWDQINLNIAGQIKLKSVRPYQWQQEMPLKPGKNEILFTAMDSEGRISTRKIFIERLIDAPEIKNIRMQSSEVPVFSPLEIQFDVLTVADTVFYEYDSKTPQGIEPQTGVTVRAIILTPNGEIISQPAFYSNNVENIGSEDTPRMVNSGGNGSWFVRFTPQQVGVYQITLAVQDRSGEANEVAGAITVAEENESLGFIGVCEADTRYFCFSDGTIYFPSGPVLSEDFSGYRNAGINFTRIWMAPFGAYSTTFSRWVSSGKVMGNEGFEAPLSYQSHYPTHELSYKIDATNGDRLWLGWIGQEKFPFGIESGAQYFVKLRYTTRNMKGPNDPARPFGLLVVNHPWVENNPNIQWENYRSLIPVTTSDQDWHTSLAIVNSSQISSPFFSIVLSNMESGQVFVDEFSIRKLDSQNNSGELIFNSQADIHKSVESKAAAYIDQLVNKGEKQGIYFKFVVHDKNDWIQNHLLENGEFDEEGDGYFQGQSTKANWLLRQWWRYVIARWGYSTAIHSWELLNEGPPNHLDHYGLAQQFGEFMHTFDSHPHLVTTSFWYGWEGEFWADSDAYPDIDYADYHLYVTEPKDFQNIWNWSKSLSEQLYERPINKPVLMGELGFFTPGDPNYKMVFQSSDWFHDLIWSQVSADVVFTPVYWWNDHLESINYRDTAKAFNTFMADVPLAQKQFSPLSMSISSPGWFYMGQKSQDGDYVFAWLHYQQSESASGITSKKSQGIQAEISLNPSTPYRVNWYDTIQSRLLLSEEVESDSAGKLILTYSNSNPDLAVKIIRK